MSTEGIIEYDPARLQAMTAQQLLLQIICLLHLNRPEREHNLLAGVYARNVIAATEQFVAKLTEMEATGLAKAVGKSLVAYRDASGATNFDPPPPVANPPIPVDDKGLDEGATQEVTG